MLAFLPRDHEFESQSGQNKDYKIYTCCFFSKGTVLKSKIIDLFP